MEYRQLKYFISVAETGSFSATSKACNLTQGAISQQIKALEDEIKVQLFTRNSHHVQLTNDGKALLIYAKQALKALGTFAEQAKSLNNMLTGELNIGVGSFIEPYLRKAAARMLELHPEVRLSVTFGKAHHLNRLLRNHEIDLAFTMNSAHENEGIQSTPTIPFSLSLVMKDTHPLAKKESIEFDDLLKYRVIMPDAGERAMKTIREYIKLPLEKLNVCLVVNDADAALKMVQEANYITFLPCMYVNGRSNLVARKFDGLKTKLISNAHWMKDACLKRSAQVFLDILKEYSVPYCSYMN